MKTIPPPLQDTVEAAARDNPDAMVTLLDEHGVFHYASPSAQALFGYEASEIVGHDLGEFFSVLDTAHLKLVIQDAILNGLSIDTARNVKLKDGRTKCMQGRARGLTDPRTHSTYVLAIGRSCNEPGKKEL
jgi:PAS domain S-box-containing protein